MRRNQSDVSLQMPPPYGQKSRFSAQFSLAKPPGIPYLPRPRLSRTFTNEDPGEILTRQVFKNRPT
jgi:hypothetical protein